MTLSRPTTIDQAPTASTLYVLAIALGFCLLSGIGCRSGPSALELARQDYYRGEFESCRANLDTVISKDRRNRDIAKLELAVNELAAGNAGQADAILRECRDTFDQRTPSETLPSARTMLTDDRDAPYDAAGYEDVMIRSLLSISSMLSGSGDAEAYAMQAQIKQTELARNAEERGIANWGNLYQPLALSPYIRGVLREASHHDYDDAARAYELVAQWQPDFKPAQHDVIRASTGTHSQSGNGVLYVFALVGRGPVRVEDHAEASGEAMLIADRIVDASSDLAIPPTLAPIPIPRVVVPPSPVQAVGVRVAGVAAGATNRITNVGELATAQCEAELPWTVARGVVRRVAKKAMVSTGAKTIVGDSPTLQTGISLLGSVWEATERADTRCWGLLPREIQVLRLELPAGTHQISTEALGLSCASTEIAASVPIIDGRNSYLLVVAPHDRITAMNVAVP